MSLMRHENEMQTLREHMNRFFETGQETGGASGAGGAGSDSSPRAWAPAVDVAETESEIVLHAELPGMRKEDIDIQLTGDRLTLRGERRLEQTARGEHFHRIERQYGAWQRTFGIEAPIDTSKVSATYEEGVLTVRLPKQEAVKPRQIEINVK